MGETGKIGEVTAVIARHEAIQSGEMGEAGKIGEAGFPISPAHKKRRDAINRVSTMRNVSTIKPSHQSRRLQIGRKRDLRKSMVARLLLNL